LMEAMERPMRVRMLSCVAVIAILAGCSEASNHSPPKNAVVNVTATVETQAMQDADDAADDPAIWVDAENPANSVIIGTNKQRGLGVYGLDGKELSFRADGRMNNVDLRQNVVLGGISMDIVAATNRTKQTISLYMMERSSRSLKPLAEIASGLGDPYGVCLYLSKAGTLHVFANDSETGTFKQWRLSSADSISLQSEEVRTFKVGSQAEGCVADDANARLIVAEEDVGLWSYGAEPSDGDARSSIDTVARGHLSADAEGVALVDEGSGAGYLIVSSQGSHSYNVYDRASPHAFRGAFVVADGTVDGTGETDGLDVTAANLGPAFPGGLLAIQDGFDGKTKANQNFKLVPWPTVREALKLPAQSAP